MITPDPSSPPNFPPHSLLQDWVTCRYGWLIEVCGSAVVAAQPWPALRAWYRRCKGEPWHPIQLVLRVRRDGNDWRVELQGAHEGSRKRIRAQRSIRCRMENPPFIPRQVLTRRTVAESAVGDPVKETDPHGNLEFTVWWDRHMETNHKAVAKYIQQIPDAVLAAVAEFPERHWNLLAFAALGVDAMKLIETTPGLAVALSSPREFRDISPAATPDAIREMLGKRQIEIAGWLGFPGVGRSVEVIRKLPPQECSVENLLKLRNHMNAAVRLHQVPCINTPLLRTLAKEGSRVRLLEDYLAELGAGTSGFQSGDDCAILRDVQWMRRRLGDHGVVPVSSSEQLRRLHDSLLERFGRTDLRILNRPPLPPPPLDPQCPFLNIEPVTTEEEVLEEAKRLDGDLDGYIPRILKGELYLYRVRSPEDIIFTVHLWRDDGWRLQEIKRRDGKQVSNETLESIFDWLEMHNQSPEP
jgi:hypothetical protein